MVKFIQIIIMLIAISGIAASNAAASSYSIAILPATDLAIGNKGINFDVTSQLIKELRQYGLEVIAPNEVLSVMAQQGIRRCDKIDSFTARKMALALKCDALLLTTSYRHELTLNQSNLILTLLHGKNGQPVWSKMTSAHMDDSQPLFGIKPNRDLAEMQAEQIHSVAQQLIAELPTLPQIERHSQPPVQVATLQLSQPLINGESPIHCRIKVNFLNSAPDQLLLSGGQQPITLSHNKDSNIYTGTFISKLADGEYNLSLSAQWSNQLEKTVANVATYKVVNQPAQLTLSFRNGIKLDDVQAFSSGIKVIPKMEPQRPLDLWQFTMADEQGDIVFSETKYTSLPKEMYWNGTNNNSRQLDSGYYTLALKVRDIAGNETQTTSQLYLQSTKMELANILQYDDQGQRKLELLPTANMLIPVSTWVLTLENKDGEPKFMQKGAQLPATITIPDNISAQKLFCSLSIKDTLGNRYITTNTQLKTAEKIEVLAQSENGWKADF